VTEVLANPSRGPLADAAPPGREASAFHAQLPGYARTPLVDAPRLASRLGVGRVWIKDESSRLGLPSFKILGASWAIYRALRQRGLPLEGGASFAEVVEKARAAGPLAFAAATDGNHGRAVAHMARLLGCAARIYVPAGTAQARVDAIAGEGASVEVVDGTYGDAVARSAADASETCIVVSDTSWPGYVDIPRWVIEGYSTILWEIEDELRERGERPPATVVVQIGVGALAAAVVAHVRSADRDATMIGVEPAGAACVLESARAGRIVSVPGPHRSIMAGLNCDEPSLVAWPLVSRGIDWFVAVDDERAREAMRLLAQTGIVAGETGAAGLAGLLSLPDDPGAREQTGLDRDADVLLFCTEGATDPDAYRKIVGADARVPA
jgi:diaminopropionate ammonia-lyase